MYSQWNSFLGVSTRWEEVSLWLKNILVITKKKEKYRTRIWHLNLFWLRNQSIAISYWCSQNFWPPGPLYSFKKLLNQKFFFFLIWLYLLAFIKLEIKIKRHLIHSNMQTFQNLLRKYIISCCAESKVSTMYF